MKLTQLFAPSGLVAKSKVWLKIQVMKWLGPKGIVNKGITRGPYAKQRYDDYQNLTLKKVMQSPHGFDLGALKSCFPKKILTPNGKIQLAPAELVEDLDRLRDNFTASQPKEKSANEFLLIGRRDPRTCNSWMHNSYRLVKGKPACIAHMNNQDASLLNIENGQLIEITSRVGNIKLPVKVTETIMAGTISVPHGWGHGHDRTKMSIANAHVGVSVNQLTDEKFVDQLTGNAVLNGVPVKIASA